MRKLLGVSGLLVCFVCSAATPATAADDAAAVIEKAIKAAGGKKALKKYKGSPFKGTGTVTVMGMTLEYSNDVSVQMPDKFRVSINLTINGQDFTVIQVVNGKKAWTKLGDAATIEMSKIEQEIARKQMAVDYLATLLPLLDKKRYTMSVIGEAKVGESQAIGINVTAKGGIDVNLYFDKKTYLLVKQQYQTKNEAGAEVSQEVYLSKYKKVNGVPFPSSIRVDQDGKKFVTAEIAEAKILEKVADSVFAKP